MTTIWREMSQRSEQLELTMGNPTQSFVESGLFVKKLTVIAASVLAKKRRLFPEHCFQNQRFFGTDVTMMASDANNAAAQFLRHAVDDALEAFDRHYLRTMVISLYASEERPETLFESFYFSFHYKRKQNGPRPDKLAPIPNAKEQLATVRATTLALLARLADSERHEPALPTDYAIVVRLFYTDETPAEYQPRGYSEDAAWSADQEPAARDRLLLGDVLTPYHKLSVKKFSTATTIGAASPTLATPPSRRRSYSSSHSGSGIGHTPGADSNCSSESRGPVVLVRCPCVEGGLTSAADLEGGTIDSQLIECRHCFEYQHAACFGLSAEAATEAAAAAEAAGAVAGGEAARVHCCDRCARDNPALICSDPGLIKKKPWKATRLCMFRRTLEWCARASTLYVSARMLQDTFVITEGSAVNLLCALERENVLRPISDEPYTSDTRRNVNHFGARHLMTKFFKSRAPNDASLSDQVYEQYQRSSQESIEEGAETLLPPPPPPDAALGVVVHTHTLAETLRAPPPASPPTVLPSPRGAPDATTTSPVKKPKQMWSANFDEMRRVIFPQSEEVSGPGGRGARSGRGRGRGRVRGRGSRRSASKQM